MTRTPTLLAAVVLLAPLAACKYRAPGRGADMSLFASEALVQREQQRDKQTDWNVKQVIDREPLAELPTRLAVCRVQAPGYESRTARGHGRGALCVVTTRDVETNEDFTRLAALDKVKGVSPVGRLLLPDRFDSDEDLRRVAAMMQADLLLVYTFDTVFTSEDFAAPLTVFSLGLLPTKNAMVTTTAAAVVLDSRNGYVYTVAEGTSEAKQLANAWTSAAAVDQARRRTERNAFEGMLAELESRWPDVVTEVESATPTAGRFAPWFPAQRAPANEAAAAGAAPAGPRYPTP